MILKSNSTYYLHNTGNNGRKLFYLPKNYHFFTQKMKKAISPFAEIIDFILEEDAFHILIETRKDIPDNMLNHNIGIMLRSYAQAINRQEKFFGSLFRQRTKAYSRMSYIPTEKREIITQYAVHLKSSHLIDFKNTIKNYIQSLRKQEEKGNTSNSNPPLTTGNAHNPKLLNPAKSTRKKLQTGKTNALPGHNSS